jgi:hypothetical protein
MKPTVSILLVAMLVIPPLATAEIYKLAVPTDKGIELFWWPVMQPIPGWHHDEGASRANHVNAFVPNGSSFSDSQAVIYARAMFKPRIPETKSLNQLIADDRKTFEQDFPGVRIAELSPISDSKGSKFRYLSFTPSGAGSWERVAYSEEDDFYLIFTVSGTSEAALIHAQKEFEKWVSAYKQGP